jgi:hypothetical protein
MNYFSSPSKKQESIAILTVFLTTLISLASPTLSKPNNYSYKINDSLKFDFIGCAKSASDNEQIVCVGNFRSKNGEQIINIGPGNIDPYFNQSKYNVVITDSRGGTHPADEIRIGKDWTCRTDCGSKRLELVEGVDYKTLFIFKNVSLPSSKLPLFFFQGYANGPFDIRVRNLIIATASVSNSSQESRSAFPRSQSVFTSKGAVFSFQKNSASSQPPETDDTQSELNTAAREVDRVDQEKKRARELEANLQKARDLGYSPLIDSGNRPIPSPAPRTWVNSVEDLILRIIK